MSDTTGMDAKQSNQTSRQSERLGLTAERAAELVGISRAHWYALRSADRVPAPIHLGRCVRWLRDEVIEWLGMGCPNREQFEARRKGRRQ